ncbi:hypothetical protein MRX96_040583 [Rhipicephalus microplus]
MAASTKTGYDPSTMQWVDIEVAETREDPIPGEDEYLQIMVRQLQEKLAKMKPRGSTAAAQPQARKTGSTPAACVESPRQLATWKPTHTPRIRSDELVIVLKPKIIMDLHAAFGPGGIGTAVQRFTGSTTDASTTSSAFSTPRRSASVPGTPPPVIPDPGSPSTTVEVSSTPGSSSRRHTGPCSTSSSSRASSRMSTEPAEVPGTEDSNEVSANESMDEQSVLAAGQRPLSTSSRSSSSPSLSERLDELAQMISTTVHMTYLSTHHLWISHRAAKCCLRNTSASCEPRSDQPRHQTPVRRLKDHWARQHLLSYIASLPDAYHMH